MEAPKISLVRVLVKASLAFVMINIAFAVFNPMPFLGKLTLYNWLLPGRERLPYGDDPDRSYNLNLYNIEAMFASHKLAGAPKAADEFRVLVIGDSSVWGFLLRNEDTLASALNVANLHAADGRRAVFYNLGHPTISLTKDLMILDEAMQYQPDLILWPVTLEAFPWAKQSSSPLVQKNAERVSRLVVQNGLPIAVTGSDFFHPTWFDKTLIGQRRNLADLVRLQLYGFPWAATDIDVYIPDSYELRATDLEASDDYAGLGSDLEESELAFDALAAGVGRAAATPVLIINEPIFVSSGANSDLRYNTFYPRQAYDSYRGLLQNEADANSWNYADLWQAVSNAEFTNTPIHLSPQGTLQFADALISILEAQFDLTR